MYKTVFFIIMGISVAAFFYSKKRKLIFAAFFAGTPILTQYFNINIIRYDYLAYLTLSNIFILIFPILFVKMWNLENIKKTSLVKVFICLISLISTVLFLYYFVYKDLISLNIFAPGDNKIWDIVKTIMFILLILIVSLYIYYLLIYFLDRLISKKEVMTLIKCKTMRTGRLLKRYFMEGISNGEKYQFQITKKVYFQIKGRANVTLNTKKGCFGGIYALEMPVS